MQVLTARDKPVRLAAALVLLCGCTSPAPPPASLPGTSAPGSASTTPAPTTARTCGSGSATRVLGDIDGDGVADPVVSYSEPAGSSALEVHNSAAGPQVITSPIGPDGSFGEPALIHQDTVDVPGDSGAGDEFGWELAADGNTLVIGAPGETIGTQRGAGTATVLRFTGSGLAVSGLRRTQDSQGFDAEAEESDELGNVLAVRANRVALGVPNESIGRADRTGIVRWSPTTTPGPPASWRPAM